MALHLGRTIGNVGGVAWFGVETGCVMAVMVENWAAIQALVSRSLVVKVAGQIEPARYALDRAMRVVRGIDHIAAGANERAERIDLARVAALYAGVAQMVAGPAKMPDDSAYDDAAETAADQLKDILPAPDMDLMIRILKEHRKRDTQLAEAKHLADALAMEEFGMIGLWNQSRQFHNAGKTIEQLLKLWKAQHDYGYWESRLRDGFHYEVSRKAAKDRLGQMKGIYDRLQREHLCEDIGGGSHGHY